MFSEKASAIARMRSKMRQKCVKNASCFIWKRGTFQNASEMRQNCVKNARNTFRGEHLLNDTDFHFATIYDTFLAVISSFGDPGAPENSIISAPASNLRRFEPPPLYMGKMGSICHFPRALPASIWGHTALKS